MGRLIAAVLTAAALALPAIAAQAMPFAGGRTQAGLLVPVADGCGINRYRDSRGICRRKYVLRGSRGKQPAFDVCGGQKSHRVCNFVGQCWTVCD